MADRFKVVEAAGDNGPLFVIFDTLYGGPPTNAHASTILRSVAELHCRALNDHNTPYRPSPETVELEIERGWLSIPPDLRCHIKDRLSWIAGAGYALAWVVSLRGAAAAPSAAASLLPVAPDQKEGT